MKPRSLKFSPDMVFGEIKVGSIWKAENYSPADYGFPPLETDEDLKNLIESRLKIYKRNKQVDIIVHPKMLEFIADIFFGRVTQAILWKN